MGPGVIVVGLEADKVLAADAGQLRPRASAEDHVLPVYQMVDRQDHDLAVGEEADPAYRDRTEQPQAVRKRQYLQPRVIGRINGHVVPLLMVDRLPLSSASAAPRGMAVSPELPANLKLSHIPSMSRLCSFGIKYLK
jgi:hypothetical protein